MVSGQLNRIVFHFQFKVQSELAFSACIILLFRLPSSDNLPKYKEDDFKYILLWNTFFEDDSFEFRYVGAILTDLEVKSELFCRDFVGSSWQSRQTFSTLECPETKCFITNKRSYISHIFNKLNQKYFK